MNVRIAACVCCLGLAIASRGSAQVVSGSLEADWHAGASDCSSANLAPIQIHAYEAGTYILRESLCLTFEAPFMYLLVGSRRALLVDTGAIEDSSEAPLAETVRALVDSHSNGLPLLVVHTHAHRDHRDGDAQFASDEVVSSDLESVREYFRFVDWPEGEATIDLGGREVLVVPAPGHHAAHLLFHDSRTGWLLAGDHLLAGRVLIAELEDYRDSTRRLVELGRRVDISLVLGAHVELNEQGDTYGLGSTHHPSERPPHLSADSITLLYDALQEFNGFYAHHRDFVLVHLRNLALAAAAGVVLVLAALIWATRVAWRRLHAGAQGP